MYFYSLLVLEFRLSLCAIFDQFKKLRTCFKDEKEEHVGSTFSSSKVIYAISFFFSNNILSFTASRTYIGLDEWHYHFYVECAVHSHRRKSTSEGTMKLLN